MTLAPAPAPAGAALSCSTLLASSYSRLATLCEALQVEVAEPHSPAAQGWIDSAELACRPELLDAFLDAEACRIHERYEHVARPDVVASRALHAYLWSACLLISGPWYLERRVPRLRPDAVRVSRTSESHAVVPGSFWCLPDDPAAGLPGVRVSKDEEALRDELRTAVADHVRPLLTAVAPRMRRGPRSLWGMVGDDLVSGIWYLGRMLGDEERAVREASEVLPGPVGPFAGGASFRRLTGGDGRSYPTRNRMGCCLYYTIRPAEACATCPRTSDAERLRRLEEPTP
ncbi:(2Fe-2S)-binding protein [Streptomyces albipurpureus]|uniref:(2Fe-2S)-binding protein n=1 Tax=Streptomyces albipurpureus TaxID=2897419 RepID=A0ABT0UMJ4_9ACTN|nr:(2Fe-2S)-binding protein [Streptomyces sp. CWNU-1]MCM2389847.1 (2Fe-2S)-binding protein [Streptomyces sp. CWNU-1]